MYQMYKNTNCDEKGIIRNDPMTKQERRGKIKLHKRATNGEIVISTTDKSCDITISSMESYLAQGEVHIANDQPAKWEDIDKAKKHALNHVWALNQVFNAGEEYPNSQNRLQRDINEDRTVVPDLILTQKNQKPIDPTTKLPKTRPVCQSRG